MKGLYQGKIFQGAQSLDLADIKVLDFLESLNRKLIDKKENELVDRLIIAINESNTDVTFNDDRYVLIATKLTRNVKFADADFSYFLLANRNIQVFYDDSIAEINNMIQFMSLFIGYSLSQEPMGDDLAQVYKGIAKNILSEAKSELMDLLPKYVKEALKEASSIKIGSSIKVKGVSDIQVAPPVVVTTDDNTGTPNVEPQPTPVGEAKDSELIAIYQESILLYQELIDDEPNGENVPIYEESILLYQELIDDLKATSSQTMRKGGKVNVKRLAMQRLSRV